MAVCLSKRLKSEIRNEVACNYTQDKYKLSKKSLLSNKKRICVQFFVQQSTSIVLTNRIENTLNVSFTIINVIRKINIPFMPL